MQAENFSPLADRERIASRQSPWYSDHDDSPIRPLKEGSLSLGRNPLSGLRALSSSND